MNIKPIIIYVDCETKEQAEKIGQKLLEKKLAACINIIPDISSAYLWKGKIERASECILLIKTLKNKFNQVVGEIKRFHSYETPTIFSLLIDNIDKNCLEWLMKELN